MVLVKINVGNVTDKITAVKLVYKDQPRDQQNGVLICRFNSMENIHVRTCKMGLYKQVVLYTGGL